MKNTFLWSMMMLSVGCFAQSSPDKSKTLQSQAKIQPKVESFQGIHSAINADITLSIGACSFEATGNPEIVSQIQTEVKNNVLRIWLEDRPNMNYNYPPIKLRISAPAFESIAVAGSGTTTLYDKLALAELHLSVAGSGVMRLSKLELKNLNTTLSGSGRIILSGVAENANFTLSGSGTIEAGNVNAQDVNAVVSGSGNIHCKPNGALNATISGSGNIRYRGKPAPLNTAINGSGTVELE